VSVPWSKKLVLRTPDERIRYWLSVVTELLQEPLTSFPHDAIRMHLAETFEVTGVTWNWREANGNFGLDISPASLLNQGEGWDAWKSGELFDAHPLVRWHAATADAAPQTAARVPSQIISQQERQPLITLLATLDSEQQLSLNCRSNGAEHRTFVLGRSGLDFSDDDLLVAKAIQPSLAALYRQVELLRKLAIPSPAHQEVHLTNRELAVLELLSAGRTSRAIGRSLSMSPRTVGKHLEHIYRKLGVSDRLNAIRVATQMGVLSPAHTEVRDERRARPL